MKGTLVMFIGFLPSVGRLEGTLERNLLTGLGEDQLGEIGRNFGVVNWIPSKWGMFGGHLGDVNWISSNWGTFKGHRGDVHYILLK